MMGILKTLDLILRLLVVPFCVATIWITVLNHQYNPDYDAHLAFHNLSGLWYMVCISGVSGGYGLFGAVSSHLKYFCSRPWLFFLADQIVAYLLVTSMASQVEFLYLAYKGDANVTWSSVCGSYTTFCNKLKIATSLHAFTVLCFLTLALLSAYRVFRRFDPPLAP